MSTVIIIGGGGGGGTNPQRAQGNSIVDANGTTVATFATPQDAIRYLRSVQNHEGCADGNSQE